MSRQPRGVCLALLTVIFCVIAVDGKLRFCRPPTVGSAEVDALRQLSAILDPSGKILKPLNSGSICTSSWISCRDTADERAGCVGQYHLSLSGIARQPVSISSVAAQLANLPNMVSMDLSANKITGQVPPQLCNSYGPLQSVNLSNNSLQGPIPANWADIQYLETVDLSMNKLTGTLPLRWSIIQNINVSHNSLVGGFDSAWLASTAQTVQLDLSYNNLTGPLPDYWPRKGNLARTQFEDSNIKYLDLSNNMLTGTLPPFWGVGICPETLLLANNRFNGTLPKHWAIPGKGVCAKMLSLAGNQLTGTFPAMWDNLDNYESLLNLDLSNNSMNGTLPSNLGNVQRLDLSNNLFSTTIPESWVTQGRQLRYLCIENSKLYGSLPAAFASAQVLEEVQLSHNFIDGTLPPSLGALPALKKLCMSNNKLSGDIDFPWATPQLREIALSSNFISGAIPGSWGILPSLTNITISNNYGIWTQNSFAQKLVPSNQISVYNVSSNNIQDLPRELSQLKALDLTDTNTSTIRVFDVTNNSFIGDMPVWFYTADYNMTARKANVTYRIATHTKADNFTLFCPVSGVYSKEFISYAKSKVKETCVYWGKKNSKAVEFHQALMLANVRPPSPNPPPSPPPPLPPGVPAPPAPSTAPAAESTGPKVTQAQISSDKELAKAGVVALAAGVAIGVGIVVCVAYMTWKRYQNKNTPEDMEARMKLTGH